MHLSELDLKRDRTYDMPVARSDIFAAADYIIFQPLRPMMMPGCLVSYYSVADSRCRRKLVLR